MFFFFFSSRRRHTRFDCDWSSDVCSSDLNSPVWFNVGCDRIEPSSDAQNWHWNPATARVEFGVTGYSTPQCSACFINSVKDSLDSILTLAKTEGMLFKWGSGTGTNLSS